MLGGIMATQCEIDTYINERLEDQIKWYDQKSSSNQNRFKKCKWAEMALGGIIAVLTPAITNCELIKYIIAASSAGIVILVALHGLHNFHENWIEYRKTSELLKNEKYTYLNKAGVYKEWLSVKCWGVHPTSLVWHQSYVWLVPFFLLKSRIRTLNLLKWRSP